MYQKGTLIRLVLKFFERKNDLAYPSKVTTPKVAMKFEELRINGKEVRQRIGKTNVRRKEIKIEP